MIQPWNSPGGAEYFNGITRACLVSHVILNQTRKSRYDLANPKSILYKACEAYATANNYISYIYGAWWLSIETLGSLRLTLKDCNVVDGLISLGIALHSSTP